MSDFELEGQRGARDRVAVMNPRAVEEAQVFTGRVYYYSGGRDHIIPKTIMVQVGHWTGKDGERNPADFVSTANAATLLGFRQDWLPAGNDDGERKLLIGMGRDSNGDVISFPTEEKASKVAGAINQVFDLAQKLHSSLFSGEE